MKASEIWGSNIDAQLGTMNYVVRIVGEKDMSRIGIFAVEVLHFNNYKMKTEKRYAIEVYEYDSTEPNAIPVEVYHQGYKNKTELKKAFKTFQLK